MTTLAVLVVVCIVGMSFLTAAQGIYVGLYGIALRRAAANRYGRASGAGALSGWNGTREQNSFRETGSQSHRGEPDSLKQGSLMTAEVTNPRVAILLCVRGCDPSLVRCLASLDQQNWPDYEIWIGLDSPRDAALPLVEAFRGSARHPVRVFQLSQPDERGSLKCSLLAGMLESFGTGADVVAMVDADSVVEADWLGKLVGPLEDPAVGVVTGTRWLEPAPTGGFAWGSEVRAIWNAAAIVQMHLYGIPWGGTLALRMETIEQCGLIGHWREKFCEDTCLPRLLSGTGLRIVRPAGLMVTSDEACSLHSVRRWITRQLLTARLYHRDWPWVAVHGILVGSLSLFTLAMLLVCAGLQAWGLMGGLAAAWVGYQLASGFLLQWVAAMVWRHSGAGSAARTGWKHPLRMLLTIPLTQFVHLAATWAALLTREVVWRGIRYRLERGAIRRLNYHPYEQPAPAGSVQ